MVGDVMLDRYWFGEVSRISPEAPVPVVLVNEKREELRLGGAANVAHNCAALGARTRLLSVIGADALVIVTEWQEFRSPDFGAIKAKLKTPAIFDGRNLYDPAVLKGQGFEYFPIGRKT